MKIIIKATKRVVRGWSAESKWCALAAMIALSPILLYWGYSPFAKLLSDLINIFSVEIVQTLHSFLTLTFMFVICMSPAAAAGWLTGFYVKKAAKLKKKIGLEFYWGVIFGICILIPFAILWGFVFSEGIQQAVEMISYGDIGPRTFVKLFIAVLPPFVVMLLVMLGGAAGGLAGLAKKYIFLLTKTSSLYFRCNAMKSE